MKLVYSAILIGVFLLNAGMIFAQDFQPVPAPVPPPLIQPPTVTINPAIQNQGSTTTPIDGVDADGKKQTTIVDQGGNLKIVEKPTIPSSQTPSPLPPAPQTQPVIVEQVPEQPVSLPPTTPLPVQPMQTIPVTPPVVVPPITSPNPMAQTPPSPTPVIGTPTTR